MSAANLVDRDSTIRTWPKFFAHVHEKETFAETGKKKKYEKKGGNFSIFIQRIFKKLENEKRKIIVER